VSVENEANFFGDGSPQFEDVSLASQLTKRNLVILAIDTSSSMNMDGGGRSRMDELNEAIQAWLPRVRSAAELRDAEFAVITYGFEGVQVVRPASAAADHEDGGAFMPAPSLILKTFQAGHVTPMVAAIERGLELGRRRAEYLAAAPRHLQSGRLRFICISDGQPTDEQGNLTDAWRPLGSHLRRLREDKQLYFFAFGVAGAVAEVMSGLAGSDG
jgi:Mg-chelatase subunit ChlD